MPGSDTTFKGVLELLGILYDFFAQSFIRYLKVFRVALRFLPKKPYCGPGLWDLLGHKFHKEGVLIFFISSTKEICKNLRSAFQRAPRGLHIDTSYYFHGGRVGGIQIFVIDHNAGF